MAEASSLHSFTPALLLDGEPRRHAEDELDAAGVPLSVPHRLDWSKTVAREASWLLTVADSSGRPACAGAIDVRRSRALPWLRILRAERILPAGPPEAIRAWVAAFASVVRTTPRVLRAHLALFTPNGDQRHLVAAAAEAAGLAPAAQPRMYRDTVRVDLDRTEEELLRGFHRTARQNIRAPEKHDLVVEPVVDPGLGPRMDALLADAFRRTGGRADGPPLKSVVEFANSHPDLARVIGVSRRDLTLDKSLVAFAVGLRHGDHVEYCAAGSVRDSMLRISLGYAPAWELIRWARAKGAAWFDFGGVLLGDDKSVLAGIDGFKLYFSQRTVSVGSEWVLEVRPSWSRAARVIARAGRRLSGRSAR